MIDNAAKRLTMLPLALPRLCCQMIDNVCQNVNNNVLPLEGIVQDCQNDEDGVHAGQSDEELVEGVVHVRLREDDDAQDVADQTHSA